jgi:hypothetical protein
MRNVRRAPFWDTSVSNCDAERKTNYSFAFKVIGQTNKKRPVANTLMADSVR